LVYFFFVIKRTYTTLPPGSLFPECGCNPPLNLSPLFPLGRPFNFSAGPRRRQPHFSLPVRRPFLALLEPVPSPHFDLFLGQLAWRVVSLWDIGFSIVYRFSIFDFIRVPPLTFAVG